MRPSSVLVLVLVLVAIPTGCTGSGGGSSPAPGTPAGGGGPATGTTPAVVDHARLALDMEARRAAYLQRSTQYAAGAWEGIDSQIARCDLGVGPIHRGGIESSMDKMDAREDCADFGANSLIRLVYLHGQNPLIPLDLRQRAERTLLGFKYELGDAGADSMVYWSENHQILFATAEYLAGSKYPGATFTNAGLTGAQHAARARPRILRWLAARARQGFSEWYSPVYYEEDLPPLFNLADFAPDPEIQARAAQVIDLLLFDLARLTHAGSFGVTAGRAYEEHKWTGWSQSVGDLIEVLFGTRGAFGGRGDFAAIAFATSRSYRAPHVLLGIGQDRPARSIDRSRVGIGFGEAAWAGVGFQTTDDCLFWWGMGAYFAPETIILTRRTVSQHDLWAQGSFQPLGILRSVPEALLPTLADQLSPVSEGSVLSTANTYTFRSPDAMLSSVQSYRRGQVGYQQHAWQATLGLDACVWTTSPGTYGRDGPGDWTGSGSMPRVVQHENVAVILYNPALAQKALFPHLSHAFFPLAAFDETAQRGPWTCARKGDGYVGLYSAAPATWTQTGAFASRELVAAGDRNVWICVVGRRAEDGSLADFADRLAQAPIAASGMGNQDQTYPLTVRFTAPGLGAIEVAWQGNPTLDGAPLPTASFPRYDNPYSATPWGAKQLTIRHAGAVLSHDHDLAIRQGDGL